MESGSSEIYVLDKGNLVETAKKVHNYTIEELAGLVSDSMTYGEIIYVRIQPTHGRDDGHMSYCKMPRIVISEQLREYLQTEEAWRGNG